MTVCVGELAAMLARRFPLSWAEPWDRVGLRIGDPDQPVERVYVALDATIASIREAARSGCQVLVTHHPPFLADVSAIVADDPAGAIVAEALRLGVAVISEHTNLDRSPEGRVALARACGFTGMEPLEQGTEELDLVTVYAPEGSEGRIIDAMAAAGAGRIGMYERCSFSAPGIGTFTPLPGSSPAVGGHEATAAAEVRVEMVAPRGDGGRVACAARAVHPYEEPLITVTRVTRPRAQASLGAVGDIPATTLDGLAAVVAKRLGVPVRIWGEAGDPVRRVAFANGSGGSLIGAACAAGADVLVLGEVRYHDALAALESGLRILEAGHDATEYPLVGVLASVVETIVGAQAVVQEPRSIRWRVTGS
ncbi:Nif3-like dinuclear metal center hexameric protein [Coriobacteriia bacterium Es71-Z0120]|uniref:Nif3-like dinuclear metal center hexameric protein n=1 Tax=Parvivirga hydrogeniphila TaxID=2939460 RepID=UPI0022609E1A|nr:Nif3-like dinuclear metal center hexameric protein [Parvivirga hydrogeniphila]MCL4079069.1 Nif3-like dinuclear metal center hexameric protein [Parvivirga hydrogeniphila]